MVWQCKPNIHKPNQTRGIILMTVFVQHLLCVFVQSICLIFLPPASKVHVALCHPSFT